MNQTVNEKTSKLKNILYWSLYSFSILLNINLLRISLYISEFTRITEIAHGRPFYWLDIIPLTAGIILLITSISGLTTLIKPLVKKTKKLSLYRLAISTTKTYSIFAIIQIFNTCGCNGMYRFSGLVLILPLILSINNLNSLIEKQKHISSYIVSILIVILIISIILLTTGDYHIKLNAITTP